MSESESPWGAGDEAEEAGISSYQKEFNRCVTILQQAVEGSKNQRETVTILACLALFGAAKGDGMSLEEISEIILEGAKILDKGILTK